MPSKAEKLEMLRASLASMTFDDSLHNQASQPISVPVEVAIKDSGTNKCLNRVENLCSFSEYSEKKMRDRLKREKYSSKEIDYAVSFAVRCNLINDSRYGEALVYTRLRAGKGMHGIVDELSSHNIDPESIEGWPHVFTEEFGSEYSRAIDCLTRNPPHAKNLKQSGYRRLVGKGFEASIAIAAVNEWFERYLASENMESAEIL